MAGAMQPTQTGDAAPPIPALTPEELAPHFPQLEILECLGRGGMGVVYKARQKSLNRLVALKLLAPERADDPQFAARFEKEAHALAALNHPNIVGVYDFGQAGGFYFLLMEFVDGVNLRQLLQTKNLTPKEALSIVPPVCEALQCAHDHGIVHRDIKPENLLIDKAGLVKIADFGIAKIVGETGAAVAAAEQSNGGETPAPHSFPLGTPDYAAPEQANGQADHRADIYSLGVVLYEMLTGERPKENITPPSKRVQVDIRIDEIVLKALEKTPALRFATAAEFRTQVEAAVSPSAPSALKTTFAVIMTPEELASAKGQFGMALTRGPLVLDAWRLIHQSGGRETVIPLATVEDVSLGHLPRAMHPFGLKAICISYREGDALKRLLIAPWEKVFDAPWRYNERVEAWYQTIRDSVTRCTGKEAGTTPEDQLGLPSSNPATIGLMILPAFAITVPLVLMMLIKIANGLPAKLSWFPAFVPLAGYALIWLLPWIVGRADGRDAARWYHVLALAAVWWFASMPVIFWIADVPKIQNTQWLALMLLLVAAPIFIGLAARALRRWQAAPNGMRWIKAWSWVGWCLAVPAVGFAALFFIHSAASESGGWLPSPKEMWAVPLIMLAALSLPPFSALLWRAAGGGKKTFIGIAMTAIAAIAVGVIAFSVGMGDRRWGLSGIKAPDAAHVSQNGKAMLVHKDNTEVHHILFAPKGGWSTVSDSRNTHSLHWLETGSVKIGEGRTFSYLRESHSPHELNVNGEAFDLRRGKVLVLLADGRVEQMRMFPSLADARAPEVIGIQIEQTRAIYDGSLTEEKARLQLDLAHQQLAALRKAYAPAHPIIIEYQELIDSLGAKISQSASERTRNDATERLSSFEVNGAGLPPEMPFIAWQPQDLRSTTEPTYRLDGTPAQAPVEKTLLEQVRPVTCDNSKVNPEATFLHFWFSHPLFESDSLVDLSLTTEAGNPTPGTMSASSSQRHNGIGWIMATRSPGLVGGLPKTIDVRLRYVIGPLKEVRECEVSAGNTTMMSLHGGSQLGGYGQTHEGRAFLSISVDRAGMTQQHFSVEAVLQDGRKIFGGVGQSGAAGSSGVSTMRFEFSVPIASVDKFRIGVRDIQTKEWRSLVLPPRGSSGAEAPGTHPKEEAK